MVEIIPKEIAPTSRTAKIFFYLAQVFLISSVISFFILNNSVKSAQKKITDLQTSLIAAQTPENKTLEKEILTTQSKIDDFTSLISQHLKVSSVFSLIEKATHPEVWFTEFSLNPQRGSLLLSGEASSFNSLGQQILILKGEENITAVNLEDSSLTKEGKISFNLALFLKPEIFKQ